GRPHGRPGVRDDSPPRPRRGAAAARRAEFALGPGPRRAAWTTNVGGDSTRPRLIDRGRDGKVSAAVRVPLQAGSGTGGEKLGFTSGQVVQEFGYDSDVDDDLRFSIEDLTGTELVDEDYGDVADAAMIWWRQDDGDLAD